MLRADATGETPLRLAEELASIHETTVAEMLNTPPATIDRACGQPVWHPATTPSMELVVPALAP